MKVLILRHFIFYFISLFFLTNVSASELNLSTIKNNCKSASVTCQYHKNGKLKKSSEIIKGKKNGVEYIFTENEVLLGKLTYKKGLLNGEARGYLFDTLESSVTWVNGKILGYAKWYDTMHITNDTLDIFFNPIYAIQIIPFKIQLRCKANGDYFPEFNLKTSADLLDSSCEYSFEYPIFYSRTNSFSEFKSTPESMEMNKK